jgi:DNA modification methylase
MSVVKLAFAAKRQYEFARRQAIAELLQEYRLINQWLFEMRIDILAMIYEKTKIGDALEILKTMPDESVNMVCTSPPYWNLRDYQIAGQIGLEDSLEEYIANLVNVFHEVKRVLKDDGVMFLNCGDSYAGSSDPFKKQGMSVTGRKDDGRSNESFHGSKTNKGTNGIRNGPDHQQKNARSYGKDGKEPLSSQEPDSAYYDLCDVCRDGLLNHRRRNENMSAQSSDVLPETQTTRDSVRPGSGSTTIAAASHDVPASTIAGSSHCSHCSNCGACLSVLRSSSLDARLCVRKSVGASETPNYTADTALPSGEPKHHNQYNVGSCSSVSSHNGFRQPASSKIKNKDMIGVPWMLAFALRADGWYLRSEIIWHKPVPMPESCKDRPTKSHEQIFLLTKSPKYFYDAAAIATEPKCKPHAPKIKATDRLGSGYDAMTREPDRVETPKGVWGTCNPFYDNGPKLAANKDRDHGQGKSWNNHKDDLTEGNRQTNQNDPNHRYLVSSYGGVNARSVWTIPASPSKLHHFAMFPPEVAERCILAGCPEGGIVLDPFSGAGTTLGVAIHLKRNCIGIELNPEYAALSDQRYEEVQKYFAKRTEPAIEQQPEVENLDNLFVLNPAPKRKSA